MKRFCTIVLSVLLFAILFALASYVPSAQREPNIYYFSFLEMFVFGLLYAGPVYLLVGLPLSVLLDKCMNQLHTVCKWRTYFAGLTVYSLTGMLVGAAFLVFFSPITFPLEMPSVVIYGFIASNCYFHLSLLFEKKKYATYHT